MSSTDRLNFSQEEIFKTVCANLDKNEGKTKNLIDCKDDIIFVWDSKTKQLLTQIVKGLRKGPQQYQTLQPTQPPVRNIHFIRVNNVVTKVALWGQDVIMVMDIPKRWGSQSGFQGGRPVILCRCISINLTPIYLHNVEIQQVRFHPGSTHDNHLVVLTSDNTLRVYKLQPNNLEDNESELELIHVWALGQQSYDGKAWNLSGSKVLVGLRDMAVDFDFGLPVMENNSDSLDELRLEGVLWPTIILRGNGDVCIMNTSLTSNESPKVEGPLTMYPPADDNYGVEACSILVLSTVPPVVIVATSSGTLYHSVLLKTDKDEKSVISNTTHALYVIECVELELGIHLSDDDPSYTCPILLHKDPLSRWKYYTTHNTGIHAVSASFVRRLEDFFEMSSSKNISLDQPSTVEYLVCTRTNATPVLPVLGFAIVSSTNVIVAVLANGDVVSLPLKITEVVVDNGTLIEETVTDEPTPIKKLLREPFDVHIKNLLKRNLNQPLMKLDKNVNLSPRESLDLISRTTKVFRQEYFTKFQLVKDEIEQRVLMLRSLKTVHMTELKHLENEKSSLQEMAEKLAEKYEEIKEKQQSLNERIENAVSAVLQLEPIESLAEKKMKNELIAVEGKVEYFEKTINRLKKQMDYQKFKKSENRIEKQEPIQLGGNQIETIKTSLNKTSQDIADIVKVVNAFKKQLNISQA